MPDLDDYKNISMEELGRSLLSQKAAGDKRRRRRGRKDERINKILAVLLGAQAIFKTALNDRILEGDELELVQKMSDAKAVTEMQTLANVYSGLDEKFLMADNAWELYQDYDNNSAQVNIFREGAVNALTGIIQKQNPNLIKDLEDMNLLNLEMRGVVDEHMAEYFFKQLTEKEAIGMGNKEWAGKTRAQVITTGAMDYFGTDAETAISQMFGIDNSKLQGNRLQNKLLTERNLKGSANLPGILSSVFKGERTIFGKRDPLEQEAIKEILEVADLDQFMAPKMKEIMLDLQAGVDARGLDRARTNQYAMNRDLTEGKFNRLSAQVIQEQERLLSSGSPAEIQRLNKRVLVNGVETSLGEAHAARLRLLKMSHEIVFNGEGTAEDQVYAGEILAHTQAMIDQYEGRDQGARDRVMALIKTSSPNINFDTASQTDIWKSIYLFNIDSSWAARTPEDYVGWGVLKSKGGTEPGFGINILPGETGFISGELAIDEARPKAAIAKIRERRRSNLIPKNIDNVGVHLTSPISRINENGKPVYSEELMKLLKYADEESIDNVKIVISNFINDVQKRGYGEEGEQILETLLDDKTLSAVFSGKNTNDILNSYREGSFSLYDPIISVSGGLPFSGYPVARDTSAYTDYLEQTSLEEKFPQRDQTLDIPTITSLLDRE